LSFVLGEREKRKNALVNLNFIFYIFLLEKKVAAKTEPVDDVENQEEEGHGDEEEPVDVDVVLAADPLVPRQLDLAQRLVSVSSLNLLSNSSLTRVAK
jgi:hypothetical protein